MAQVKVFLFLLNLQALTWRCFLGGWEPFIPFNFSVKHRPKTSLIHVKGWERGQILFDQEIYDRNSASLNGGRVGVLAFSQKNIRYSNLSYRYFKGSCHCQNSIFFFIAAAIVRLLQVPQQQIVKWMSMSYLETFMIKDLKLSLLFIMLKRRNSERTTGSAQIKRQVNSFWTWDVRTHSTQLSLSIHTIITTRTDQQKSSKFFWGKRQFYFIAKDLTFCLFCQYFSNWTMDTGPRWNSGRQ